jgi:tryptophan synthase
MHHFLGSEDFECKDLALSILRMRILGADVVPVDVLRSGEKGTLRDAVNEAFSVWARELKTRHFVIGSAFGPHPYPTIVRTFQTVIGTETRVQFGAVNAGRLPDALVSCVGGGSNAVGMFYPFLGDASVALVGVQADGDAPMAGQNSALLDGGPVRESPGLQIPSSLDEDWEVDKMHFVPSGLHYPGVGPELSSWKESGRVRFVAANDWMS